MARYAVLIRGINVGRAKRISMAELTQVLEGLGYTDVRTVLQSGNAVLSAPPRQEKRIATALEAALAAETGVSAVVLVRTRDQIAAAIDGNPLPVPNGSRFMVTFLTGVPDAAALATIDRARYLPEEFAVGDGVLYVWCANGITDSALLPEMSEKKLKTQATARNWNTVTKLLTMLDG
jgi:uncharacterized protein (DUF1697 family)